MISVISAVSDPPLCPFPRARFALLEISVIERVSWLQWQITDLTDLTDLECTMKTIGGPVRYDLLVDKARIANRPTTMDGMRQAALDLRASGLTVADISRVLDISEHAVEQLLGEHEARP